MVRTLKTPLQGIIRDVTGGAQEHGHGQEVDNKWLAEPLRVNIEFESYVYINPTRNLLLRTGSSCSEARVG